MHERDRLIEQLEKAHAGHPWHGTSRNDVLARLDARRAAMHPVPGAHSAWEIVLHLTTWTREIARRVRTGEAHDPADADWPALPEPADDAAWARARAALDAAHAALLDALRALPPGRFDDVVADRRADAHTSGGSFADLVHGALQHDVYHSGQIAMVEKATR